MNLVEVSDCQFGGEARTESGETCYDQQWRRSTFMTLKNTVMTRVLCVADN
jgi:hypothetical protein